MASPDGTVRVSAHARSGGSVPVAAHYRYAPGRSAPAAASAAPPAQARAASVAPRTVPGGALLRQAKTTPNVMKPKQHFVAQETQTVGVNPNPPAKRQQSVPADSAVPLTDNSPTGFSPYFNVY
jgi:hypothetical protein